MQPIRIEPTFNDRSSDIHRLVEKRAEEVLRGDAWHPYKKIAQEAIASGLIRKKTIEEIQEELKTKPWLKVNKTIKENEDRNNSTTNHSNHSG